MGLQQGCPLSATLFGLFIDGLHHSLEAAVPTAGLQIFQMQLRELVYADDICLLASWPEQLQALIGCILRHSADGDQCAKNEGHGGVSCTCTSCGLHM